MRRTVKPKRRYDSSRRREQALETQRRILDAARGLLGAHGWTGTTMDAIARDAGVAVETVYAAFGGKSGLLRRLIEVALRGDEGSAALLERKGPEAVMAETDPQRQVRMFAEDISLRLERVAPVMDAIRAAGAVEPDMAALYAELQSARLRNLTRLVQAVRRNGPLRAGLSENAAAESVWALASPELYRLLTQTRGWSREQFSRWLGDSLGALLLRPARVR